jgi:hypothetical protein
MWWGIPSWALGVGLIILVSSLGRALAPWMRGRASRFERQGLPDPDTARLTEAVDDLQKRLGEMEERLDFAERMIAQQRDGERLGPPKA